VEQQHVAPTYREPTFIDPALWLDILGDTIGIFAAGPCTLALRFITEMQRIFLLLPSSFAAYNHVARRRHEMDPT
jgi:hypothetical protein